MIKLTKWEKILLLNAMDTYRDSIRYVPIRKHEKIAHNEFTARLEALHNKIASKL
jgi:hypothetical protein